MRPHTVLLGAGATIAAIPTGDRNGNESAVMNDVIDKLELADILNKVNLHTKSKNLEDIYSELYSRADCVGIVKLLEDRLYKYFASLELPDDPTVYDFLVLSLTNKDVIATFNWDPLLLQAYARCTRFTSNLPHILCLHGNVSMGYCIEHKEYGMTNARCPICHKLLPPTQLLYPTSEKDYAGDEYIRECWSAVEEILEKSFAVTIFGYSAPVSDKKAVALLSKAWGDKNKRQLEEVSVIDVIDEAEMLEKWKDFIYSHHYNYTNSFYDSYLGLFPRRSCEMIFATYMLNVWGDNTKGFKCGMTWKDVEILMDELLSEELVTPNDKNYPLHYVNKSML